MRDLVPVLRDIIAYLRETSKWWLLPALIVLCIVAILLVTAGSSPVPVFVYPVA